MLQVRCPMSAPGREWVLAVALLVVLPVLAGAGFHAVFGTFPGVVMFSAAAGIGLFVSLARVQREVRG